MTLNAFLRGNAFRIIKIACHSQARGNNLFINRFPYGSDRR